MPRARPSGPISSRSTPPNKLRSSIDGASNLPPDAQAATLTALGTLAIQQEAGNAPPGGGCRSSRRYARNARTPWLPEIPSRAAAASRPSPRKISSAMSVSADVRPKRRRSSSFRASRSRSGSVNSSIAVGRICRSQSESSCTVGPPHGATRMRRVRPVAAARDVDRVTRPSCARCRCTRRWRSGGGADRPRRRRPPTAHPH